MKEKIVIDDLLLNYYTFSKEGKKTVLFLHGWRSNGSVWQNIAQDIRDQNLATYAIDFPGFGESTLPKKDFTVKDYAEVVESFIRRLNFDRVILVGHSFGGRVAIKLTATHPEIVEKLVLVDSAGLKPPLNYKNYLAKVVKPLFKPKFMHKLKGAIYHRIGSEDYNATPELRGTFLNIVNEDLARCLPDISRPTLLIWGENDQDTPITMAKIMNERIKMSELEVLPGAGHFSFIDAPANFCKILLDFLR